MSCCGSKRQQQFPLHSRPVATIGKPLCRVYRRAQHSAAECHASLSMKRETALTVTGRATGRCYRFPRPGARLAVDPRDAPALRGIAVLRRV